MKFPIKLNRTNWPQFLTKIMPSQVDPRVLYAQKVTEPDFTSAVSVFKFGSTFKSTKNGRFPLTIMELSHLKFNAHPIVLDVGASDGSTSLDIIQAIPFDKYFVTDLNIEVFYIVSGNITWFYDEKGFCIMRVSNKWVIYNDINGAIFFLKNIVTVLFKGRPKFIDAYKITLINPRLHAIINENIIIKKYNMFTPWLEEKVDLIIAANILNQIYFTNAEIILAFEILTSFLNENGRIAIVENRKNEQCSIFHFQNGSMRIEKRIALGTEIESLIMNNSPRN